MKCHYCIKFTDTLLSTYVPNHESRVNCFQLIYFKPTDFAILQTHIGVSEVTMVHVNKFKLALCLYRVTVMTVYGADLIFPLH